VSESIPTSVHTNTGQCRDAGAALTAIAGSVDDAVSTAYAVRGESETTWQGTSGQSFRSRLATAGQQGDDVTADATRLSKALIVFADEVDAVRSAISHARTDAKASGLLLTADAIQLPYCLTTDAPISRNPAFEKASSAVRSAREREHRAHETLGTVLAELTSVIDYVLGSTLTKGTTIARYALVTFAGGRRIGRSAAVSKRLADAALTLAQDSSLSPILRMDALQLAQKQTTLFQAKVGTGQATKRILQSAPISKINKVYPFTYSGAAISAVGVGLSIKNGTPADRAIASGAASFVAGAAVTVALGSGPPGWIVLGASMAISTGVGYLVDQHWDGIKHGLGDAMHGVKNAFGW
jgi:hypothetical protein